MEYLLNLVIACPLVACLFVFMMDDGGAKRFGRIVSLLELVLVLILWASYRPNDVDIQFSSELLLIPDLGISYSIFVDGISLFLLVLTAFIIFLSTLYLRRDTEARSFVVCLLSLEGILMALFMAENVLMFYTFWELALLPVLYLVGVWGGGSRIYIALKFFVYTFASSVIMLLAIVYMGYLCYLVTGAWSFKLSVWSTLSLPFDTQKWLFLAFLLSIAVKIPIVPLHTWLPHIYSEAPTVGSVVLSALLSKMGTYALLRFVLPLFPDASVYFMPLVSVLAVVMVIYAGIIAFKQTDIKKVIAYSSISHMGLVVLGIFSFNAEGLSGAIFMMVAHGVTSGGLFLLAGLLSSRAGTRQISEFGGVAAVMPHHSAFFALVMLSNVGLPLTIGFVGEFLALYGFFQTSYVLAALAGSTVIISACYMLYLFKNIFYGAPSANRAPVSRLRDLNFREYCLSIPLAAVIVWLGVLPTTLLSPMQTSVQQLIATMHTLSLSHENKSHISSVNGGLIGPMLSRGVVDSNEGIPEEDGQAAPRHNPTVPNIHEFIDEKDLLEFEEEFHSVPQPPKAAPSDSKTTR